MKIQVWSRGATVISADSRHQEPFIREALRHGGDTGSEILECADYNLSDISYDHYAVVSEDDGTELWRGWLTGDPNAAAPDTAGQPDAQEDADGTR